MQFIFLNDFGRVIFQTQSLSAAEKLMAVCHLSQLSYQYSGRDVGMIVVVAARHCRNGAIKRQPELRLWKQQIVAHDSADAQQTEPDKDSARRE